jgi:5-methylcytosine-specific restriction endonuclease McrA
MAMTPTLLLDATYEPLQLISWQKAMTLLFLRKVEVLAHYEQHIHGGERSLAQPAVVRLNRRVPWRKSGVRFSRRHVFQRDGYACQYCGEVCAPRDLTFDHVFPRSRGGETGWSNIVTSCRACNQRKGDRTPEEARMTLLRRPVAPRWLPPHVKEQGISGPHPLWEPYLWWAA